MSSGSEAKVSYEVSACTGGLTGDGDGDSPSRSWAGFSTCRISEVARLGLTLQRWQKELLASFATPGACYGGTEAVNGLVELQPGIARGFRDRDN